MHQVKTNDSCLSISSWHLWICSSYILVAAGGQERKADVLTYESKQASSSLSFILISCYILHYLNYSPFGISMLAILEGGDEPTEFFATTLIM